MYQVSISFFLWETWGKCWVRKVLQSERMWNNLNDSPYSHFPDLGVFIQRSLWESLVRKITYCVFKEINPHPKLRGLKMSMKNTPFWTLGTGKSIQENKHLSPSGCHLCPSAFFFGSCSCLNLEVGRCEVSRLAINCCNSFLKWSFLLLLTLTKPNHSYQQQ